MATYSGTPGNDTYTGTPSADRIDGNAGDDTLNGGAGDDRIRGGTGLDVLIGGTGNDRLFARNGSNFAGELDQLDGRNGDDTLQADAFAHFDGGEGFDTVVLQARDQASGVAFNYGGVAGTAYQIAVGGAAAGSLTDVERFSVDGSAFADSIGTGGGDDRIAGIGGADILEGGAGNDHISGGNGNDALSGGDGGDWLFGDAGEDVLAGGASGDTLDGGGGNDTLFDGYGNDLLVGGAGRDIFVFSGTQRGYPRQETIADFVHGQDKIDLSALGISDFTMLGAVMGVSGANTHIQFWYYSSSQNITIEGILPDNLTAADFVFDTSTTPRSIFGSSGRDVIFGGRGDDTLDGYHKADTLFGGAGNDSLYCGWDNDAAFCGSGDDTLYGSGMRDMLDGGAGSDTLDGESGGDTLFGGYGSDTLFGGTGADTLDGGAGSDRLRDDTGGWDTLTGGGGRDVFEFGEGEIVSKREADTVADFSQADADRINLGQIDADTAAAGDQRFRFIGDGDFTGIARQLHFVHDGGKTYVEGDTDGDGARDFVIVLTGTIDLTSADFVL